MESAVLIRTCSFPAQPTLGSSSPTHSTPGGFSSLLLRSQSQSPVRVAIVSSSRSPTLQHADKAWITDSPKAVETDQLRRARSEADLARSGQLAKRIWTAAAAVVTDDEELEMEFSGGGMGKGKKLGGSGGGGGGGDREEDGRRKMCEYYQEMLKADPSNPLLLQNYGRFLHEVEGDSEKAEEYYGRAILASPQGGDGEVLSLYGKLVWETHRDGKRAEGYFDRAVQASPDDCYVLGSYAHFLWDADEEEEEESRDRDKEYGELASSPPLVQAF